MLSPGYDFVAMLPYLPNDTLGLSFGGSRSLFEITPDQMRRFADTARIPARPLWRIAVETAECTAAAWKGLQQTDMLARDLRASIEKQILAVADTVQWRACRAPSASSQSRGIPDGHSGCSVLPSFLGVLGASPDMATRRRASDRDALR